MAKGMSEYARRKPAFSRLERFFSQFARISILLFLLGAGAAALLFFYQDSSEKRVIVLRTLNGEVRIPMTELTENRAEFFSYYASDQSLRPIRLLAWKSSPTSASAALDACKTCYKYLRGYHQSGGRLKCVHCGEEFRLGIAPSPAQMDCYPISFSSFVRSNQLVVKTSDLDRWLPYFNVITTEGSEKFRIQE